MMSSFMDVEKYMSRLRKIMMKIYIIFWYLCAK